MSIAVTGATGQLGTLVIEELLLRREPKEVVALARDPQKGQTFADQGVDVRRFDYTEPDALREGLQGVERLLLISSSEVGQRFVQHRNVIDASRDTGVKRIVYTSAPHATTSALVLAPEHKATEEYLIESGVDYTIVRNNWYHENYLQNVDVVRATGTLVAAAGDGLVASASRADYAAGAVVVLTEDGHAGQVYEFSGDTAWHYDELAAALSEVAGRDVVYRPVSQAELVTELVGVGIDEPIAQFVAALDANIAAGALSEIDPVLSELIGRPTTPLAETLRDLA